MWGIYIVIYPLIDARLRGQSGLTFFDFLCYSAPLFAMIGNDFSEKELDYLCKGIKYLARFQCLGILISIFWYRLYIILTWRILGNFTANIMGFTPNQAIAAFTICAGYCIALSELLFNNQKRKDKFMSYIELLIYVFCLVQTTKRFVLIALVFSTIVILIFKSIHDLKKLLFTIAISIVMVATCYYLSVWFYNTYGEVNAIGRLGATITGVEKGEDISNNRSIWAAFMTEWGAENKMFGIGWESFRYRIHYTGYPSIPNGHNVFRQVLCETGYFGETIFIGLLIITFLNHFKIVLECTNRLVSKSMISASAVASISIFSIFFIYRVSGNAIYDSYAYLYLFLSVIYGDTISIILSR